MADTVSMPILTDETGKQILAALHGISWRIDEANALAKMGIENEKGVYIAEATLESSKYTLQTPYASIRNAYENRKLLILKVLDKATNQSYFFMQSRIVPSGTDYNFFFVSAYKCGIGSAAYLLLTVMKTGNISASEQNVKANASDIACNVTIGGTAYTNVEAALAALAAG